MAKVPKHSEHIDSVDRATMDDSGDGPAIATEGSATNTAAEIAIHISQYNITKDLASLDALLSAAKKALPDLKNTPGKKCILAFYNFTRPMELSNAKQIVLELPVSIVYMAIYFTTNTLCRSPTHKSFNSHRPWIQNWL